MQYMKKDNSLKKAVVAMSGGVDSSVSAALLKKATPNNFEKLFGRPTPKGFRGYDVTGIFMKCWSEEEVLNPKGAPLGRSVCTAVEDEYEARKVAAHLGIPFYTFDLVKEYKERVADYFVSEYAKGRTPNPDVMCNKEIKFGIFFEKVIKEMGADFVATGHYGQIEASGGGYKLLQGKDPNKDQSYFLYRIGQEHLAKTLFPVGGIEKPQVRELAREFNLPNAERKDSQGLCFIGKVKVQDFLQHYIPNNPGPIVDHRGVIVGEHEGLHLYTIGQRKGIGIGGGVPYYVVDKERETNTLHVAFEYDEALKAKECKVEDVHWISDTAPELPLQCDVRIRYRQARQKATITSLNESRLQLLFDEPQRAVTSGQSAVFYLGEECLGGGIIV